VPTHSEGGPEVAGERAHVGAGGAVDRHVEVDDITGTTGRAHVERMDGYGAGRQLDGVARPHLGVGPLAVDLDGADRGRHLLDRAGQPGDPGLDLVVLQVGCRRHRDDLALGVVGHRAGTEPDRRVVGLVRQRKVTQQPGGPLDPEHQQAGGHRVERAGVTDAPGAGEATGARDDVVGGQTSGLVDQHQPAGHSHESSAASVRGAR
jgi:hypothetical protein